LEKLVLGGAKVLRMEGRLLFCQFGRRVRAFHDF